ncbi:MAG: ABC transporter permease [Dehalococcoidia bacterium]
MLGYVIRRLGQALPVLFLASVAVFMVLRLVPGDPAVALAGPDATPQRVLEIRQQLGLTQSWPRQYLHWVGNLLHGDLGTSLRNGLSVGRLLKLSFPPTLELTLAAFPVAVLIGIPLGVAAGVRPRSAWDWALSGYTLVAIGIPHFLLGILMLWIFSVDLGWFPSSGRIAFTSDPGDSLKHLVLPALALGGSSAAVLARYTRTAVQQTMGQDFIRTARAKGLRNSTVVVRHGLRGSLIPVVTIVALQVGHLLAGAVVIEQVFTRPGLGRLVVDAIQNRDYLIVQSTLVVLVTIFIAVNLVADLSYGLLDPRVRYR